MDDVRLTARMYSLVASMHAVVARISGMEAYNATREQRGESVAYGEGAFEEEQAKLEGIATALNAIGFQE